LDYYKTVANTQYNQDILKAELSDLIDEVITERQEIVSIIDGMIKEEKIKSEGDMTFDATDLLTELKEKLI